MYSCQITSTQKSAQGNISIFFTLTDNAGRPIINDHFDVGSLQTFNDLMFNRLKILNEVDTTVSNIPIGAFVPTVPTTDQPSVDLYNFSRWMQLTIALNAAKSLGWITGNEQVVLDAKAKVLALAVANIPKLFT